MSKIAEASIELHELNAKLAVQKVVVAEKTLACETLLGEIMEGMDSVSGLQHPSSEKVYVDELVAKELVNAPVSQ